MTSEAEFLAARADASGITTATARAAVDEVCGQPPQRVEQFAGGWGAVPFWVTAADGTELVVRVGIGERAYGLEAAVIGRAAADGIPVPDVVGVTRIDGHPVSIQTRLPGTSLNVLAAGGFVGELEERAREAGMLLRRVHALDPAGLDLPEPDTAEVVVTAAEALGVDAPTADRALLEEIVDRLEALREPVPTVLAHRDFGADHVLVSGRTISGIIDWERASLADPAQDLAWWVCYGPYSGGGAEFVRAGYGAGGETFDARVRAWALAECVSAAHFNLDQGRVEAAAGMLARAGELLTERSP